MSMLTIRTAIFTLGLFCGLSATAQEVRYITDKHFVPLRSGPGSEYRIVHRGLPTGTQLEILTTSEDGDFAEVTTQNGTQGWIRAQYLVSDIPASTLLASMQGSQDELKTRMQSLQQQIASLKQEKLTAETSLSEAQASLGATRTAYEELEKLSGDAITIDSQNKTLAQSVEALTADKEMLEAENRRLQAKMENNQFMDGALAVALGVIITLLVPRLWPQRKRNSGWS
jgi:SH3 domain protein